MTGRSELGRWAVRFDSRIRGVVLVLGLMHLIYLFAASVFDSLVTTAPPTLGLRSELWPTRYRVLSWALVAAWVATLGVWIVTAVRLRRSSDRIRCIRTAQGLTAVLLLAPFVTPVTVSVKSPGVLLACIPTTAFGLWLVHGMQRYRRMPVWLPLAVAGWGAVITGFVGPLNLLFRLDAIAVLTTGNRLNPDPDKALQIQHDSLIATLIHAGIVEEPAKAAGVAIAFILFRHHIDGVVSGIVLGAAAGLGFNFIESVEYISEAAAGGEYQYFMRQTVGLMAAHTAFSALAGAAIGAARQLTDGRRRIIICGLLAAIGSHVASNVVLSFYGQYSRAWFDPNPTVDILVLQPLLLLLLQGPAVVMYLVLLRQALRSQAAGLGSQLTAEARTGTGTVTGVEIPVLLSPARRLWLRFVLLRRHGIPAWRSTRRLHAAQLDLAAQRWHHARLQPDPHADALPVLRERVLHLKQQRAALFSNLPKWQQGPAVTGEAVALPGNPGWARPRR